MYSKQQVDDMLDLVEKEFEQSMVNINKSENTEEEVAIETEEIQEEVIAKSEEIEEEESEEYQSIDDLYGSMSKSEKEAHYNAAKNAYYNEVSEVEEEVIAKSEEIEEEAMVKSEIDGIKAENEELKKSMEVTNELLAKLFNNKPAPAGKSITGLNVINKSEGSVEETEEDAINTMSKSEITSKLKSVDYSELTKSDRNAINEYCLNNASVDSIKHLINK